MWLGEQISDKGIGNGVSLIIFIGIVLRYPTYVAQTVQIGQTGALNVFNLFLFIAIALVTIVSIVFMYQGQRRVPVQQARRVVGRKMFAGRSSYIPLRLNNAGVISIIFAISILLLPQQALSWFQHSGTNPVYWHAGPLDVPANSTAVSLFLQTYFSQTLALGEKGALPFVGIAIFVIIAAISLISIIFMYQGQRRVPVQYAKRVVGRKVYGGRSTYIPLRLNNAGVISIIFAISILLLPQQISSWASNYHTGWAQAFNGFMVQYFNYGGFLYNAVYFLLVVGFTFFYSEVVVNIMDIGDSLKKQGGFIPGIRPGKPTTDYLQKILHRITVVAAVYLGVLAILPNISQNLTHITTIFLGSTSLLIVVGVALDTMTQLEARLAMRDYRGFIKQ
jgi:preprotein translocase subunit SecY